MCREHTQSMGRSLGKGLFTSNEPLISLSQVSPLPLFPAVYSCLCLHLQVACLFQEKQFKKWPFPTCIWVQGSDLIKRLRRKILNVKWLPFLLLSGAISLVIFRTPDLLTLFIFTVAPPLKHREWHGCVQLTSNIGSRTPPQGPCLSPSHTQKAQSNLIAHPG